MSLNPFARDYFIKRRSHFSILSAYACLSCNSVCDGAPNGCCQSCGSKDITALADYFEQVKKAVAAYKARRARGEVVDAPMRATVFAFPIRKRRSVPSEPEGHPV